MSPITAIVIAIGLLVVNGFFTAAEFAVLAARRSRIDQLAAEGSRGALAAQRAQREISLMLAGAQLGITMTSLALGAIAEPAVAHLFEGLFERIGIPASAVHPAAIVVALTIVVFCHMVVAEMAPKSWAITAPDRSAVLLSRPFRAFTNLVRPFLVLLNAVANGALRLVGVAPAPESTTMRGPAELAILLEESVETGTIAMRDADRVSRALELSGLVAADVMVPRAVVDAVPVTASVDHIETAASVRRRSRLLVYGRDLDDVRGVIHLRDVIALDADERAVCRAEDLVFSILPVRPDTPLEDVLLAMQREHRHLVAVKTDGRLIGIVTMQDVLRHLIGRRPARRIP